MRSPPSERKLAADRITGSVPSFVELALSEKLENERDVLEAFVTLLSKGEIEPSWWERLHQASLRDRKQADVGFAFESLLADKRIQTLANNVRLELYYQAGRFFELVLGDDDGGAAHHQRALAPPTPYEKSFRALEALYSKRGENGKRAALYIQLASTKARSENAKLLAMAGGLLEAIDPAKAIESYEKSLKLDPTEDETRLALGRILAARGLRQDEVRIFEQRLAMADPVAPHDVQRVLRSRLVQIYEETGEVERATPHVEALLLLEPTHEGGRRVARKLLASKGVRLRASLALAEALAVSGEGKEALEQFNVQLEVARGGKRAAILRRMAKIRADQFGDALGAYDLLEQALLADPGDVDTRTELVPLATSVGKQLEAAKTVVKASSLVKDLALRADLALVLGDLYLSGGDPPTRTPRPSRRRAG